MIKRYEGTGRMSRVVEHNETLYLCGQTDGTTTDIESQTKGVLKKIDDLLAKYGSDKKNILMVTIYLRDIAHFDEMNKVWDAWVVDGFEPARATVESRLAREHLLVEMTVTAVKA